MVFHLLPYSLFNAISVSQMLPHLSNKPNNNMVKVIPLLLLLLLATIPTNGFLALSRTAAVSNPSPGTSTTTTTAIIRASMSSLNSRDTTRLFMSNETLPQSTSSEESNNPLDMVKKAAEAVSMTGSYRTFLFCGAFLGSPKIRDFIGIPGCVGVVAITWAVYTYDTRFNYLVDQVTPKRQQALKLLREANADRYSSKKPSSPGDGKESSKSIDELASLYEEALQDELATRIIIPGLWYIEMDPTQEDRTAAPQFLGLEITKQHTLEPIAQKTLK